MWLDVPPAILAARLSGQSNRPLLAGADLPGTLAALAARRERHYRLAHHRVDADAEPGAVVSRILALLHP